jgi:hypothetical protein
MEKNKEGDFGMLPLTDNTRDLAVFARGSGESSPESSVETAVVTRATLRAFLLEFMKKTGEWFVEGAEESPLDEDSLETVLSDMAQTPDLHEYSELRIERYMFTPHVQVTLGRGEKFSIESAPEIVMRPQRVIGNIQETGVAKLVRVDFGGQVLRSLSGVDMASLGFGGLDSLLGESWPTLSKNSGVVIQGEYTGKVPLGHKKGSLFTLCFSIVGPGVVPAEPSQGPYR